MATTPNQTLISINYAAAVDTAIGNTGTASFNLAGSLYDMTSDKKALVVNSVVVTNSNAESQTKSATIKVASEAPSMLFFAPSGIANADAFYNGGETLSDWVQEGSLKVWPPKAIVAAGESASSIANMGLTDAIIKDLFNFGTGNKLKFGVEIVYQATGPVPTTKYYDIPLTDLVFTAGTSETIPASAATANKPFPATISGSATPFVSNVITIPQVTVETAFGITYAGVVPGSTMTISPVVYIGSMIAGALIGKAWKLTNPATGAYVTRTVTRPATANINTIEITNAYAPNTDNYTASSQFGWTGNIDDGVITDTSITITVR